MRIAQMYQRKVLPIWIAGPEWMDATPLGFGGVQYIDARGAGYKTAANKIVKELRNLFNNISITFTESSSSDFEPRNPYKGLRAFNEQDAKDFFGREVLITTLVEVLKEILSREKKAMPCSRLLTVIGSSGSGKSSIMRAGVLSRLKSGGLPGSENWIYLDTIEPGTHPIKALTLALETCHRLLNKNLQSIQENLEDDTSLGLHALVLQMVEQSGRKVVLFIDQFEQLFTQTQSEAERQHFIDILVTSVTEPHGVLVLLLTLRGDFYDRVSGYPELSQLVTTLHHLMSLMTIQDMRAVIEKPTTLPDVQLTFEDDLVGDLLFECREQVGALPLLEFALEQLFERRHGRLLTQQSYQDIGGVKGAITKHAEETYEELPSDRHRELARILFLRLLELGNSDQDATCRRVMISKFSFDDDPLLDVQMREAIEAFITARLLTADKAKNTQITTIEISHEALIHEWRRLSTWIEESCDDIRLQQIISKDVTEWEQSRRPVERLYRGSQLKDAQAWAKHSLPQGNEVAFLNASIVYKRLLIVRMFALILLLGATIGTAIYFHAQIRPDPAVVTNLNDHGQGSLPVAINMASTGSTITFSPQLKGTILLTHTDLNIAKSLRIQGPGAGMLSISSGNSGHIVHIYAGFTVVISGLSFVNSTIGDDSFISNFGILTIIQCIISGNRGAYGAIRTTTSLTLDTSTVTANIGYFSGGITNFDGPLNIMNSIISKNIALNQDGKGGGIFNEGILALTGSTLFSNSANGTGGAGGGIYDKVPGTLAITNSTISGNQAESGGGIAIEGGVANIIFCTIYNNFAHDGGGVWVREGGKNQVTLKNSLLAGNHATTDIDIAGGFTSYGYNLIQHIADGSSHSSLLDDRDLLGISPEVGPLQNNGGLTPTNALLSNSPAIDQIPLSACHINGIVADQRGVKRPQGSACDIGAFEYNQNIQN